MLYGEEKCPELLTDDEDDGLVILPDSMEDFNLNFETLLPISPEWVTDSVFNDDEGIVTIQSEDESPRF